MNLTISNQAASWYKDELHLKDGDFVRFYVRYGGFSSFQTGFSLGVANDKPVHAGIKSEAAGVTFFIEEDDLWYLDNHDISISINEKLGEPEFARV